MSDALSRRLRQRLSDDGRELGDDVVSGGELVSRLHVVSRHSGRSLRERNDQNESVKEVAEGLI